MISIRQLRFLYPEGSFTLRIPELDLNGTSAVIAGPSGSGKTTLLHLLAGILPAHEGEINVAGQPLHQLNDSARRLFRLRNIGLVFQDFQLIEYLSVLDNVLLPCRIHREVTLTDQHRHRALELLNSTGIEHLRHRHVTQLSQGEKQRVAICRALLMSPRVVLADEPTGNLDPATAGRIVSLLLEETARSGAMLVMVTHDHTLLPQFERTIWFEQFLTSSTAAPSAAVIPAGAERP